MSKSNGREDCSAIGAAVEPARVRRRLARRAAEISRREADRAIAELERDAELAAEQRTILEQFAASLAAGLIAGPTTALAEASPGDADTARTVARLFDLEEEPEA